MRTPWNPIRSAQASATRCSQGVPHALDANRLWCVVLAAAFACGGGEQTTAPNVTTPVTPPVVGSDTFHLQTPHPATVAPTLDPGRASTLHVTVAGGGTITATAANGTKFQLVIPPNGVPADTDVTMTPLASLSGLPFDAAFVGAVQLAPDGLLLAKLATLTITPATAVPADHQVTFGYRGAGTEFHLEPTTRATDNIVIGIAHFSGDGLVSAPQSVAAQAAAANSPTSGWDQYMQQMQEVLAAERAAQLLGQPSDPQLEAKLKSLFDGLYRDVVKPAAESAASSDEAFMTGMTIGLAWMRMGELLGTTDQNDPRVKEILDLLGKALDAAIARSVTACTAQHDLSRFKQLLGYARMVALLGTNEAKVAAILKQAFDCMHFELEFTSSMYNSEANAAYSVHAIVPLDYSAEGLTGKAPLNYAQFTEHLVIKLGDVTCTTNASGTVDGEFSVIKGVIDLPAKATDAVHPSVTLDPGNPVDITTTDCYGGGNDRGHWWRFYWANSHPQELFDPANATIEGGPWTIEGWTAAGPGIWRKQYDKTEGQTTGCGTGGFSCGATETTKFELRHVPKTS